MKEFIAGVEIPDTKLVAEATELVHASASTLLYHHSRRVYLFGTLQGAPTRAEPGPGAALRRRHVP